MSKYPQRAQNLGEQVADLLKPVQDLTVDVVSTVAETVADFVPSIQISPVSAEELTDANFSLAEQLLANQRAYVGRLLKALEPITGKFVEKKAPKQKIAAA